MEAQALGWMIAKAPGEQLYELYSLRRDVLSHELMPKIIKMAALDPLCAKAITLLSAQKLQNPDSKVLR